MKLFSGDKKPDDKKDKKEEKKDIKKTNDIKQKPQEIATLSKQNIPAKIPINADEKLTALIHAMNNNQTSLIKPEINFEQNTVSYPILESIGENISDNKYLEYVSSGSDVLKREIYERLLVCPDHPDNLFATVRMYCPHCSSLNVEKLNLVEHKVCGYIADMKEFGVSFLEKIQQCPKCKREVTDQKKEIRLPGGWHACNTCKQKFDNIVIKLHCIKQNHDFTLESAKTLFIPCYKINEQSEGGFDKFTVLHPIKKSLESLGFAVEEMSHVKGKSGMVHEVSLFSTNQKGQTIAVIIKNAKETIDDADVNSTIINMIDISPSKTIFIGIPLVSERAKTLANAHKIAVITGNDVTDILSATDNVLENILVELNTKKDKLESVFE